MPRSSLARKLLLPGTDVLHGLDRCLDRGTADLLPTLGDERVVLVGRRSVLVDVAPTAIDNELLGALTRLDA